MNDGLLYTARCERCSWTSHRAENVDADIVMYWATSYQRENKFSRKAAIHWTEYMTKTNSELHEGEYVMVNSECSSCS